MSRSDKIMDAYEAWNPDQESSTDLAERLGISKARLYQILKQKGVTPKARRPPWLAEPIEEPKVAFALNEMPTGLAAGVSVNESWTADNALRRLLDELDALRKEVAEYHERYGPLH